MTPPRRTLITGGTGSVGRVLVRRLLKDGGADKITIFSRDESKQHQMKADLGEQDIPMEYIIGDVRNLDSLCEAVDGQDVIYHAAALKHVPPCEYQPYEAVQTNLLGAENLVRAVRDTATGVVSVVGVSTDKACNPICVMGMTKALQERILIQGNIRVGGEVRFVLARFGNLLESRGSVIRTFRQQLEKNKPLTLTDPNMTRFFLTMDEAVDTIMAACHNGEPGDIFIPRVRACSMLNIAKAVQAEYPDADHDINEIGHRPGEKLHELMVCEEEARFVEEYTDRWYVLRSMIPEVRACGFGEAVTSVLDKEYSSKDHVIDLDETKALLVSLKDYHLEI